MTITPWTLYWITRLDEVKILFFLLSVVFVGVTMLSFIVADVLQTKIVNVVRWTFPIAALAAIIAASIPTSHEAIAFFVIPKIVNNERVQGIPDKFLTLAEEWMEEMRPKKEGK